MECFAAFLFLVIAFVVVLTSIADRYAKRRGRRRLFTQLAKQFAGKYDSGGIFSRPSVRLRYGDTWAAIDESRAAGPFPGQSLQIRIAWPHTIRCEIVANFGQPPNPHLHTWPHYSIPDQEFSSRYLVCGPVEADVRQMLTAGVQLQVERLRKSTYDERLYVLLYDGQIIVRKRWPHQTRIESAIAFVQAALELYDQCMLAKACGIEFLNLDQAQTLDDVICKICGETIVDEMVYCRRCKTPHHRDCWDYAGGCSVYGCRETVYLSPQPSFEERPIRKPR